MCKRRLNNINITLNITLPKRGNGADFNTNMLVVDTNRFAELHPIEKRHPRSHSHSFAQFFYVCVHVLVLLIFLNRRRAQLSCRVKAAEPIVFHYIIRAKLFPNYPIISTRGTYDFVQGVGLGLYGPSRIVIPLTFFFPVAC